MTTRELIARIQELDPSGNMLVTEKRCSDNGAMDLDSWSQKTLYRQNGGEWLTERNYGSGFNRLTNSSIEPIEVVHFEGN